MSKSMAKRISEVPADVRAEIEGRAIEAFVADVKRESPRTMARILRNVAEALRPAKVVRDDAR